MSKRGGIEVWIILAVVVVAVIGLYIALKPTMSTVEMSDTTGNFAAPKVKQYGGSIRGVAVSGTRAFPAGRAITTLDQTCYVCNCIATGITSINVESATKVCTDNCGGSIVSNTAGPCR